jgi:hypothetical protein
MATCSLTLHIGEVVAASPRPSENLRACQPSCSAISECRFFRPHTASAGFLSGGAVRNLHVDEDVGAGGQRAARARPAAGGAPLMQEQRAAA